MNHQYFSGGSENWRNVDLSGLAGGLNGSTQHFPEVYSQESENPKFVVGVDLSAALHCWKVIRRVPHTPGLRVGILTFPLYSSTHAGRPSHPERSEGSAFPPLATLHSSLATDFSLPGAPYAGFACGDFDFSSLLFHPWVQGRVPQVALFYLGLSFFPIAHPLPGAPG